MNFVEIRCAIHRKGLESGAFSKLVTEESYNTKS